MSDAPETVIPAPASRAIPDRAANLLWSALFAAPVGLAAILRPSAEGMGTHQQLGLPPCTFLWMTGFPCPFCGMTTSWAHAAHGDVIASLRTQPMGFLFFVLSVALALFTLTNAILGRDRFRLDRFFMSIPAKAWWSGLAALFVAWIYKSAVVRGWI